MVVYQNIEIQFALAANEELLFLKYCAIKSLIPTIGKAALLYILNFETVEIAEEFINSCKHFISEMGEGD